MKRCPTCQRTYADDAPAYCVSDGTRLVTETEEDSQAFDPQKTILASTPPPVPRPQAPQPPPAQPPQPPPPAQGQPIPPPPQQQYSPAPPPINPPVNNPIPQAPPPNYPMQGSPPLPPPAPVPQQQQAPWPPPQGGYNYQQGGGYYPPGQQGFAPQAKSGGLSLITIITGAISGIMGLIMVLIEQRVIRIADRGTAYAIVYAGIITGGIALILGIMTLISKRQRGKGLAAVGLILGAFTIGFWIYLEIQYGVLF